MKKFMVTLDENKVQTFYIDGKEVSKEAFELSIKNEVLAQHPNK